MGSLIEPDVYPSRFPSVEERHAREISMLEERIKALELQLDLERTSQEAENG